MSRKKTNKKQKKARRRGQDKQDKRGKAVCDQFNRRLGTQGFRINTKMSKTPKSISQLAKETKLPARRIGTHVRDLTKKGFFVKNKDGEYSIK